MTMSKAMPIVLVLGLALVGFGVYKAGWAGGSPEVVLASGQKVSGKDLRAPVTAELVAQVRGSVVYFTLRLSDGSGRPIRQVLLPGGKRPSPPKITVLDSADKVVYQAAMRYG